MSLTNSFRTEMKRSRRTSTDLRTSEGDPEARPNIEHGGRILCQSKVCCCVAFLINS